MNFSKKVSCPKCGGSGKVEHTHVAEGVCFMCRGFGLVFPERVDELTEKAKIRKAKKEAKVQQVLKEYEEDNNSFFNKVYDEITRRNILFYKNYKCSTSKGAMQLYKEIKGIANVLGLDNNSSKSEVLEMFNDYFNDDSRIYHFRIEVSKLCEKHFGFMYISLDGRDVDLTGSEHEVQNLIKKDYK